MSNTHLKFQTIDQLFAYLIDMRKKIGKTVFVDYTKLNTFSIERLLDKFIQKGYLLHGSFKKLELLIPRRGGNRKIASGNFKAVFGTDSPIRSIIFSYSFFKEKKGVGEYSWEYIKNLLACKKWSVLERLFWDNEVYIYICKADYFIKIPICQEYVCFKEVVPDFVVGLKFKECLKLVGVQDAFRCDMNEQTRNFFDSVREAYKKNSGKAAFLTEHGLEHAVGAANFSCIISGQEFPELMKDVIIGTFFHDIGRVDNCGGYHHAIKSSSMVKKIVTKFWPDVNLEEIIYAIRHHADGKISDKKIVGCIWDADRLDRIRLGHKIDLNLLSTQAAKKSAKSLNSILDEWRKRNVFKNKKPY